MSSAKVIYQNLGNVILGQHKQIEQEVKNPKNTDLECELIINSDWLENIAESKIFFSPKETKKVTIRLNSINILPGKSWGEILLLEPNNKEVFFRKVFIASFIPHCIDKSLSENTRPFIKITGNGIIDFGEIKIKVMGKDYNIKEPFHHAVTIHNQSQSEYLDCELFSKEKWIKVDKDKLIVPPRTPKDINVSVDIEELEREGLNYAQGNLCIVNNSCNQPEINCIVKLAPVFDYPPYPYIEQKQIELGSVKPGNYPKEITLLNSGKKLLVGHISTIPQWIDVDSKDIKISPNEKQILKFNINISSGLSDKTELKDRIKIVFNEPCEEKELDITVSARVDKREILVKITPEEINIGNIIKGPPVTTSFELVHNHFSPIKVRITCYEKWIKQMSAISGANKEALFKQDSLELDINPDEKWIFKLEIDTSLCFSEIINRGEIKLEFINTDTANKFIKIILYPIDAKNFLLDFGQYPINLGNIKSGENITKELEIKYLGYRKDIKLVGNIISLTDWLKVDSSDFTINSNDPLLMKFYTSFSNKEVIGRKEGIILVNFQPDKCIPNFSLLPQQVETVIVNISHEIKFLPKKIIDNKEKVSEEKIVDTKEKVSKEEIIDNKEKVSEEEIIDSKEKVSEEEIVDNKEKVSEEEIIDNKEKVSEEEIVNTKEKVSEEEIIDNKEKVSQEEKKQSLRKYFTSKFTILKQMIFKGK